MTVYRSGPVKGGPVNSRTRSTQASCGGCVVTLALIVFMLIVAGWAIGTGLHLALG